ncbi:bifunctional oligoribonuclease/PAP phosphatase NrnA [Spiroplasma endosymbiont of Amphibalanus improvisus]|uniref:DHH family phosphoesterase n=1 Tax=Spiroplasma endosymbiont of Amphibalanus improvisus TaxID=3066327 RepID=UPI00313E53D7
MSKIILKEIQKFKNIILTQHINPDGDAIGSSLGLKFFIEHNFPDKIVKITGDRIPQYLNFLGGFDNIENIELSESLLIISDTANESRIDFTDWKKCKKIIKIDHHISNEPFGDINLVEPEYIANCEIVFKILENSKLELNKKILEPLMLGLITDSGRFLYPKTNEKTFHMAQKCLQYNVDIFKIYNDLYVSNLNIFKFKQWLFNNVILEEQHGFGYVVIREKDVIKQNVSIDDAKSLINILSNINEIKIWFFVVEDKKSNFWKISIRSRHVNLINLVEQFNGGGHKLAAGCSISNLEELPNFIKVLKTYLN